METVRFEEMGLSEEIQKAVRYMGFEEASPIQAKAIPAMISGIDLIGQAQTGTGKTAAFGIPILEKVDPKLKKLQAIVLCPTRELAIQVADEIRNLSRYMHGIKVLPIYGGQDIVKQIRSLKSGTQIVIGTPGRVMDHMRRKTMKLDFVHTVVLDEADEMLNMGFREDIEFVLSGVPEERQTVLFSATMPKPIMEITKKFQNNAKVIKVTKKELTVPNIEQYYYDVKPKKKEEVLSRLLDIYSPRLSVVFCNTKKQVDLLVNALLGRGYFAAGLHGDMKQEQRDRVMQGFRTGKTEILVATDVAARGIDVDEVEAVFNYDLPQDDEYYVHRIGRTGRAGREGRAFSFVSGKEVYKLKEIQRYCKTKIYAQKVPSLNDVANTKMENILDDVERVIEQEDLDMMINAIEERVNNSEFTAMDMAAAFLKICCGMTEDNKNTEENDWEFGDTGAGEDGMVNALLGRGYFAAGLHGDMKQEQRDRVMQGFRTGKTEILVATDVAARGIDVDEVEAVFNYDLPQDDEYYVHRIGRTGRAGREGRAFSFVSGKEVYKLKEIQRYCKTKIYAQKVPSLNDVANTKMENILDDVERVIEQEDLDMMINAIEERVNNSEFTAMDMAAAFLKICCGMTEDNKNTEENDWEFGDTGAGEDGMVRLFINIGKKQRVRPGDILGAIAGESGMDGKLIGTIDMYDKYTFVEVPREYAREVLNAMKNVKIKGKTVAVEPANQK